MLNETTKATLVSTNPLVLPLANQPTYAPNQRLYTTINKKITKKLQYFKNIYGHGTTSTLKNPKNE
jgi:hypothetical protein